MVTQTKKKLITVAHSPDSDDAFMFYAIANKKIDLKGYEFEISSGEIDKLNRLLIDAASDAPDICAVSFHAYAYLADKYQILKAGSSMGGANYGPRVVAKAGLKDLKGLKIAIPGKYTSAYLCLQLFQKEQGSDFVPHFCAFDEVFDLVKSGEVDAGLLIHESQLKFAGEELELIVDLGKWWYERTEQAHGEAMSMPLGCNVIDRSLGEEAVAEIAALIKESIEFGLKDFDNALAYAREYSKNGLDDAKAKEYIGMYVNDQTLSLKDADLKSIKLMLEEGHKQGLLNSLPVVDPV